MIVLVGMFLLGLFIALGSWVVSSTDHVKKVVEGEDVLCLRHCCVRRLREPKQIDAVKAPAPLRCQGEEHRLGVEGRGIAAHEERDSKLTQNLVGNLYLTPSEAPRSARRTSTSSRQSEHLRPVGVDKVDYAKKKTRTASSRWRESSSSSS